MQPPPPPAPPQSSADQAVMVLILGAIVGSMLGSFLPWVTATAPFVGTISASGMQGDGMFTLAFAVIAAIIAWPLVQRQPLTSGRSVAVAVLGALTAIVAAITVVNASGSAGDVAFTQVGIGAWLCLLCGVAMVAGAIRSRNVAG